MAMLIRAQEIKSFKKREKFKMRRNDIKLVYLTMKES